MKKGVKIDKLELKYKEEFKGDVVSKSCEILRTQPQHLVNTTKRFIKEIESKL